MPLVRMIEKYVNENNTLFHMPGHKGGRAFAKYKAMRFLKKAGLYDLTEVPGTDNLTYPEEEIKDALEECAKAFGADSSFFLVNGSTCGIHALIGSACKPGEKLIVARDCHQSVINAMMLFDIKPVYIYPDIIEEFGIVGVISLEDVENAIKDNPDCTGVFITRPTYYGLCCDIEAISEIVHRYDKILIVDEAHGAHLPFGGSLYPQSSVKYADACVQSAHKTLAALNQGAYIHLKGNRISKARVGKMLQLLQTSSPSYLIMASLDFSRALMESYGARMLGDLYKNVERFKKLLLSQTGLKFLDGNCYKKIQLCHDRIVINTAKAGFTGFEAEKYLREKYKIQVEMPDLYNIVLLTTVFDEKEDFDTLLDALKGLWEDRKEPATGGLGCEFWDFSKGFNPALIRNRKNNFSRDLLFREIELVPLEKSAGRVAGELAVLYPPGIPLLVPGDCIDAGDIDFMKNIMNQGGKITGLIVGGEMEEDIYIPCFLEEA